MKEYRYSGPASGVTLSDGTEILLWPGKTVSLPPAHRLCSHQSAEAAVTAK